MFPCSSPSLVFHDRPLCLHLTCTKVYVTLRPVPCLVRIYLHGCFFEEQPKALQVILVATSPRCNCVSTRHRDIKTAHLLTSDHASHNTANSYQKSINCFEVPQFIPATHQENPKYRCGTTLIDPAGPCRSPIKVSRK